VVKLLPPEPSLFHDLFLLVITMSRKRSNIVEYTPELDAPTGPTPNITHHTHYERRRRPVKSTVTLDMSEEQLEVVEPTVSSVNFQSVILDDGGLEQLEFDGQRMEMHGLPLLGRTEMSTAKDTSEVSRKKRRTQGVSMYCYILTNLILPTGSSSSHLDQPH
jgi:hypothetical protein